MPSFYQRHPLISGLSIALVLEACFSEPAGGGLPNAAGAAGEAPSSRPGASAGIAGGGGASSSTTDAGSGAVNAAGQGQAAAAAGTSAGVPALGGAFAAGDGGSDEPGTGGSTMGGRSSAGTAADTSAGRAAAGDGADPPMSDPECGSHKWACWPMPNPAGSGLPNEAAYTDNGDTVTDDITGLVWEKSPPSENYTWEAALAYCDELSLGGFDDWRLPTRIELTSVMDYSKSGAKFPAEAFPGAQGGFHKTSSDWILTIEQRGAGAGTDFAWAFNMSDGIVSNAYSKATAARLRCVRGHGTGEGPSEPAVAPPNLYTALNEDEALDNYTGLIWQRRDSESGLSFDEAVEYCDTLELGGESWRLPSIRELATLVDEALVAPSINREMFQDTKYGARSNNWYWASHRAQGSSTAAWALNFDDGFTGFNAGSNGDWNYFTSGFARCVR